MAELALFGAVQIAPQFVDGDVRWTENAVYRTDLTTGTGVGQGNYFWSGDLSIASGSATTIDLKALPFLAFGAAGAANFAVVKHLLIANASLGASLTVEAGTTNGWSQVSAAKIGAAGLLTFYAPRDGLAVTATSKTVKITNNSSTTTLTGATTNNSAAVTGLSSTTALAVGMAVSGTGIPSGTTIAAITSGTAITLSASATATAASVSLAFSWVAAVSVSVAGVAA